MTTPRPDESSDRAGLLAAALAPVWQQRLVVVAVGLAGVSSLIFEVVWTRRLSSLIGASTYVLSTVLAAFLSGLALGALLASWRLPRIQDLHRALGLSLLVAGLTGLHTLALLRALTPLFFEGFFALRSSFAAFSLLQFGLIFLAVLVPTTFMGATFPLAVRLLQQSPSTAPQAPGVLYGVSTLGSVAGSLLAGFVLLPVLGGEAAVTLAALLDVSLALAILALAARWRTVVLAMGALVLALGLHAALQRPFLPFISTFSAQRFGSMALVEQVQQAIDHTPVYNLVLFHDEGVESDVYVMRDGPSDDLALLNNGKLEGGENTPGFTLLALLPWLSLDRPPAAPRVLNIGLGSGWTLGHLARLPHGRITSVELSDGVLEANRQVLSPQLFGRPDIEHVRADGRTFLARGDERFDLIVVSPSWAVEAASTSLLSQEFFALAAAHLTAKGALSLWVDLFDLGDQDVELLLRTVRTSFAHAMSFRIGDEALVIVASADFMHEPPATLVQRVREVAPQLGALLEVASRCRELHELAAGPVNTDDHPTLEFRAARQIVTGLRPEQTGRRAPAREHRHRL